eukprot:Gb_41440 [translate_table: standard]
MVRTLGVFGWRPSQVIAQMSGTLCLVNKQTDGHLNGTSDDDDIQVLDVKPLSYELPILSHQVKDGKEVEDGVETSRTARKRKNDYLIHQKQRIKQRTQPTWKCMSGQGRSTDSHLENKSPRHANSSLKRANVVKAPEHNPKRRNNREKTYPVEFHGKEGSDLWSKRAEETRQVLSKFHGLLQRLTQQQEARDQNGGSKNKSLHLEAAHRLKTFWENCSKKCIGPVPGIEVGDVFQYRVVLRIIGLHGPPQAGIDFLGPQETRHGVSLATSIVVSGGYEDNIDNGEVLIYTGQGGNDYDGSKKQVEDQKLTAGNFALINSNKLKTPVRVIRACKFSSAREELPSASFRYDGLYNVEECRREPGRSGHLVYKFKLRRQQGQPPLAFHRSTGNLRRKNVIKEDIGEGKEKSRICVLNAVDSVCTLDDFNYLVNVKYPDWLGKPSLPEGCRCIGGCKDAESCLCARRNGKEFPYTLKGTIVRSKAVVYECGPSCHCPPNCANRVAQHGLKPKLEVFRTGSRDWGVRSLDLIQAGEFIVEYTGDLIADPLLDNSMNKYIFSITPMAMEGNWGDLRGVVNDEVVSVFPCQIVEDVGFKVDASRRGNVSRFISRSNRPNIFAQYVLYDHHDIKIPHVMLFALENISPLIELKISSSPDQSIYNQHSLKTSYNSKTRMSMQLKKQV